MSEMARLGDLVRGIRSKNAGPFMITVDVFCATGESFDRVRAALSAAGIARVFGIDPASVSMFEIPGALALKFSFPRPAIQGSRHDRDMHGAQLALLLEEADFPGLEET